MVTPRVHDPEQGQCSLSWSQRLESLFVSRRFWFYLGVAVLAAQLVMYPFTIPTHIDEGSYSFYGYHAVLGDYPLYGQGGPWFQHPPLAYLVPGVIHSYLGRDFFVIRLCSALVTGFMVLLLCRLAFTAGGENAALITLWLMAGQAESIRNYCLGGPLPYAALWVVAAVYCLARDYRSPYREIAAVFFVTLALLTRTNMAFSWSIVVLYAVVTADKASHRVATIVATLLFPAIGISFFWPEIVASTLQHHLLPVFLRKWFVLESLIEPGQRYPIAWKAYPGSLVYLVHYYTLMFSAIILAAGWTLARWPGKTAWLSYARHSPMVVLLALLLVGNVAIHVVGPLLIGQPFVMYMYFNYYAPFAAILGGLGLARMLSHGTSDFSRGLLVGGLAVLVSFSLFAGGSSTRWPPSFSKPNLLEVTAASRTLAELTTRSDRIFAVTCLHEFLLADRLPYPPLLLIDALSLNTDTARVRRFGRYNYAMAQSYLEEADVVILSDYGELELAALYRGRQGAGQDVVDLVERIVHKDFVLIREIPRTSKGTWRIYRRITRH